MTCSLPYLLGPLGMQEGDPEGWWQESFKSHTDSKPNGPEAISFDLSFPQVQHVYGLPEHATSFALKPTIGEHTNPMAQPQAWSPTLSSHPR